MRGVDAKAGDVVHHEERALHHEGQIAAKVAQGVANLILPTEFRHVFTHFNLGHNDSPFVIPGGRAVCRARRRPNMLRRKGAAPTVMPTGCHAAARLRKHCLELINLLN